MKSVYLDNSATTPMLPEVIEVMQQSMIDNFGNPSSTHQFGRKAKSAIETARKNIAKHFNVSAKEIIFTSGGTEGDNLILNNAVLNLGVRRIVTSKIEHHAVLYTIEHLQKNYGIEVEYVNIDKNGSVDLLHLENILKDTSLKTLVSLMLVNNEIGNILPIDEVCNICKKYDVLFHSDTTQAIGKHKIDLQKTPIDFIVASAHKFHGTKGVGFIYVRNGIKIRSMFFGGNQEKGVRSGTENVHSISGMEKALELAYKDIDEVNEYLKKLKEYFINELLKINSDIKFNGFSADLEKSANNVLSVRFPIKEPMFLFNLDLAGIAVSGGSACQSGSNKGSHVLGAFLENSENEKNSVRFSFSKLTTKEDINFALSYLKKVL